MNNKAICIRRIKSEERAATFIQYHYLVEVRTLNHATEQIIPEHYSSRLLGSFKECFRESTQLVSNSITSISL